MASIGSEQAPRSHWLTSRRAELNGAIARGRALFAGAGDSSLVRRLAGAAFIIRIVSAFLAFVSQIVLARWLGGYEFGIYVYAWTWLQITSIQEYRRLQTGSWVRHCILWAPSLMRALI